MLTTYSFELKLLSVLRNNVKTNFRVFNAVGVENSKIGFAALLAAIKQMSASSCIVDYYSNYCSNEPQENF
jgi:hypothetical protein